jgi:hypothetical protein
MSKGPSKTKKTKLSADADELFPEVAPVATRPSAKRAPATKPEPARPARTASSVPESPAASPDKRRAVLAVAGGVGLIIVVVGVGMAFLRPESTPTTRTAIASSTAQPTAHAKAALAVVAPAPEQQAPRAKGSVAATPEEPTSATPVTAKPESPIASALARLQEAQQANDEDAIAAAKDELNDLAKTDPVAALDGVLASLRGTKDDQALAVFSSVLLTDALARRPDVALALTQMAERDEVPGRRVAAMRTLGNLPDGDVARVQLVANMGRTDADSSVREAAAVALGAIGDRSPGDVAAAAAKNIVSGLQAETDPRVRSMLIYAVRDTRDGATTDALLGVLHDSQPETRQAAADMLGEVAAAHRTRVLDALAVQFAQESDQGIRGTIITSIVSAGRLSAIPVLEGVKDAGPLQATIDDYLAGLRSGEDNMDKLQALRNARQATREGRRADTTDEDDER